jgi:predicted HicB family RNase H-like nuclease
MTDTNRNDEKFVVRLKPGQREQVKARAKAEHRTMNDVVIVALARYLEQGDEFDRLLALMNKSNKAKV